MEIRQQAVHDVNYGTKITGSVDCGHNYGFRFLLKWFWYLNVVSSIIIVLSTQAFVKYNSVIF